MCFYTDFNLHIVYLGKINTINMQIICSFKQKNYFQNKIVLVIIINCSFLIIHFLSSIFAGSN